MIAVTSANNIDLTEQCLRSIGDLSGVSIYDDASTEPVGEMCHRLGGVWGFTSWGVPNGLTNLWNTAYKDFLKSDHKTLLITNNDVIFPKGSIQNMERIFLTENPMMLGPLSNRPGTGKSQRVRDYVPDLDGDDPKNVQIVQDKLVGRGFSNVTYINGFCFMIDRKMDSLKYDSEHLIPPNYINVGNDDWLVRQALTKDKNGLIICLDSFVFHYKGMTTRWCPRKKKSLSSFNPNNTRENLWRDR